MTQNQNGTFTWAPQFFPSGAAGEDSAYNVGNAPAFVAAGTAPDGRGYFGATGIAQQYGVSNAVNVQDENSPYVHGPICGSATCTAHVDTHAIMYSYVDQKMYFGTDGGVFRFLPTANTPGSTWESANSTSLKNMLSFSLSASPTQPNVLVVGHQDDGIVENASSTWQAVASATYNNEGDQIFFDPNDPTGATVYVFDGSGPTFEKSTDMGINFSTVSNLYVPPPAQFLLTFHPTQFNRFMVNAGDGNGGCIVQEIQINNGITAFTNLSVPTNACPTAIGYAGNDYYVATFNGATALFQAPINPVPTWTSVWPNGNPQSPIVSIVSDAANANSIYLATNSPAGRVFFKPDITDGTGWTLGAGLKELTGTGGLALQFPVSKLALI